MITPSGDVVFSPRDAAFLLRYARAGMVELDRRNGGAPREAVRLVGELEQAAQVPHRLPTSDSGSGTQPVPRLGNPASSAATEQQWLSIAEAAELAGCSTSYMRRLCRKGNVVARRSAVKGAWQVDVMVFLARLDSP